MSHLNDSWMSCRQPHGRQSRFELLPTFTAPPGVHDFALENRPPTLPNRNSPSRVCLLCVGAILCVVGSYSTIAAAAGPVFEHGSTLARGVSKAVGNAISHANQEAERNAQRHYEARERYMSKRNLAQDSRTATSALEPVRSPLLLRLAALRSGEDGRISIDDQAVEQFFPSWVAEREHSWNEDAVLRDLVLAVSQIAHSMSVEKSTKRTDPSVPTYAP